MVYLYFGTNSCSCIDAKSPPWVSIAPNSRLSLVSLSTRFIRIRSMHLSKQSPAFTTKTDPPASLHYYEGMSSSLIPPELRFVDITLRLMAASQSYLEVNHEEVFTVLSIFLADETNVKGTWFSLHICPLACHSAFRYHAEENQSFVSHNLSSYAYQPRFGRPMFVLGGIRMTTDRIEAFSKSFDHYKSQEADLLNSTKAAKPTPPSTCPSPPWLMPEC